MARANVAEKNFLQEHRAQFKKEGRAKDSMGNSQLAEFSLRSECGTKLLRTTDSENLKSSAQLTVFSLSYKQRQDFCVPQFSGTPWP
jgi:hypothetical protein